MIKKMTLTVTVENGIPLGKLEFDGELDAESIELCATVLLQTSQRMIQPDFENSAVELQ